MVFGNFLDNFSPCPVPAGGILVVLPLLQLQGCGRVFPDRIWWLTEKALKARFLPGVNSSSSVLHSLHREKIWPLVGFVPVSCSWQTAL